VPTSGPHCPTACSSAKPAPWRAAPRWLLMDQAMVSTTTLKKPMAAG
jgi:hypothetical protein